MSPKAGLRSSFLTIHRDQCKPCTGRLIHLAHLKEKNSPDRRGVSERSLIQLTDTSIKREASKLKHYGPKRKFSHQKIRTCDPKEKNDHLRNHKIQIDSNKHRKPDYINHFNLKLKRSHTDPSPTQTALNSEHLNGSVRAERYRCRPIDRYTRSSTLISMLFTLASVFSVFDARCMPTSLPRPLRAVCGISCQLCSRGD